LLLGILVFASLIGGAAGGAFALGFF
jgi:hypothetical protein